MFENPLNNPPRIQGQAPKDPQKATRLCHKGIDGGMFFLPLRWTKRRATAGQTHGSFLLVGTLFNRLIGIRCTIYSYSILNLDYRPLDL